MAMDTRTGGARWSPTVGGGRQRTRRLAARTDVHLQQREGGGGDGKGKGAEAAARVGGEKESRKASPSSSLGPMPASGGLLWQRRGVETALVETVLSAITTYHMTVFPLSKRAIRKIDKLRRNFLWKGAEEAKGGHCLVNWPRVCRSKKLGGLGVRDLQRFNWALRLRWIWFRWKDQNKPWNGLDITTNSAEMELFRACTKITVGNGLRTNFWQQGAAPKNIAPLCYTLAYRKNLKVAHAVQQNRWMRGIQRMSSEQEISQFVTLWSRLSSVQLTPMDDDISWKFTADGKYTAKSAYDSQFFGSRPDFTWTRIWKAKAEPKCRFFAWLLLQRKIWTADTIIRRGGQTDSHCPLCNVRSETPVHLFANCSFSRAIWSQLALLNNQLSTTNYARIKDWWAAAATDGGKTQAVIYAAWNIWKERCRRKYDNKAMTAVQVANLVKQDLSLFLMATVSPAHCFDLVICCNCSSPPSMKRQNTCL
ncbi:hypothetical protein U9M48_030630 [Paspalum notatum var. saurae]|uniref:Reverse transcriptase zinc-binding domain-containing protein n=1 Tax=Paspalum notatum var. saurae TaxID=547442 RepID=A0AAQ3X2D9_PASNO